MTENKQNSKEIMANLEKMKMPEKTYKKLYSIKDLKGGYFTPFATENDLMALRLFADDVNNPKSAMFAHPEDYEIWKIGVMCYETGEITSILEYLARALDYKKQETQSSTN